MTSEPAPTALERLVREGSDEDIRRFLILLQPPEIADILEALEDPADRARAFREIRGQKRPSVLRDLEGESRDELLEALEPAETARLLTEMKSDDAADVLLDLDEAQQEAVLQHVPDEERARLGEMLVYSEDSAGGIMQTELVKVREDQTVREAVAEIRRTKEDVGELHEIFVVDGAGRLKGWVKERALILASDDDRIAGITKPVPVSVPVTMDQEEIADLVSDYDLSSVPVVDADGVLVGRILVDDIIDVVTEEATEDITRLSGTAPEEIYAPSVRQALRSRVPWLLMPLMGGVAVSMIISAGETQIRHAGAIFAFFPVVMGMAGSSSVQAATVAVRSIALGRIDFTDLRSVLAREIRIAALIALFVGALLWAVALAQGQGPQVAITVGLSAFAAICLGMILAVFVPLGLDRIGVDPAVATSPFVTTMTDMLGASIVLLLVVVFT